LRPIYLDNNATTRTDAAVVEAMSPFFSERFGNASSAHEFGAGVATAVRAARKQLQTLLGATHDHEIVFTSGGTESDNTAILSALETQHGRNEIVTTAVEHPAMLNLLDHLETTRRARVHRVGVDAWGRLDVDAFRRALGPHTAIASVMMANNETGTQFPVGELSELAHAAGALFHTDAVQSVGKAPLDLKSTSIDMLSLSGHKFHGPKGVGALYLRKGTPFAPLLRGGPQERRRRGGTENTPAIVGLGKAAEIAAAAPPVNRARIGSLRDRLEQGLIEQIGDCSPLGDVESRLTNTSNLAFSGVEAEAILHHLDRAGIAASLGSACSSGSMQPSHVLLAMKIPPQKLRGAVRFSLSRETTEEEIDLVLRIVPEIIAKLKAIASLGRDSQSATPDVSPRQPELVR
jgi:cysteine desulfurase